MIRLWHGLRRPRFGVPVLMGLAALLYANTLGNGYVYDDVPLITANEYVQQGWAGIPALLTTDSFDSQIRREAGETRPPGGRYRPLSLVTFAVEAALFGQVAWIRHAVNILLYAAVVGVLMLLARDLFPGQPAVWLVFGLLFAVHPAHTEVVANVKGRDELLSLLCMAAACRVIYRSYAAGAVLFVLALLAKEYAVTLLALAPLWGWLRGEGPARMVRVTAWLTVLVAAYLAWRLHWVGWPQDGGGGVLNQPYLYATPVQAWSTKILVLGRYLALLVWPHPLRYDYSYRQIPYTDPADVRVWLAAGAYAALGWAGWSRLRRRDPVSFGIGWYLAALAPVSNLVVNAGTIMAERLVFHASAGALLAAAAVAVRCSAVDPRAAVWMRWALAVICLAASARVMVRNAEWRSETTLFTRDARVAPDSALVCGNAGAMYLRLHDAADSPRERAAYRERARYYTLRAASIDPRAVEAVMNMVLVRLTYDDVAGAADWWARARALDPGHPAHRRLRRYLADASLDQGRTAARNREWTRAEHWFQRALQFRPDDPDAWRYLGGVYLETGDPQRAQQAWDRVGRPVVWEGF